MENKKIEKLINIVKNKNVDAIILTSWQDRFWITEFKASEGYVVATKERTMFFVDGRYYEVAKKQSKNAEVIRLLSFNDISSYIKKTNINSICLYKQYDNLETYTLFKNIVDRIEFFDSLEMRSIKTKDEIQLMQLSADIVVEGIDFVKSITKLGVTELQVTNEFKKWLIDKNTQGFSFEPIIAFGANSAIPHHSPTRKPLLKNEIVKCDIGCRLNEYCSDITRMFWVDGSRNDELEKIYDIVLEANKLGIRSAVAGATGKDVDDVCRNYIMQKGYGNYFIHGTGHGMGIDAHENPHVKQFNNIPLVNGNVITVEPGIYIPGLGGVRIEDTLVISDNEPIVLTKNCKK